jgi:intein/homing endonuclease
LRNSTCTTILPSESCLFWAHKIKTANGDIDFHEIAEQNGLDWKNIEENDLIGWYDLKTPLQVETKNGYKNVDKLYFNGNKEVVTLTLENGKVIKCTPNHRFLIKEKGGETTWKRVHQITEGDDIVEF